MGSGSTSEQPGLQDACGGFSHEVIRNQLDRILAHREFQATEKMRAFLRFVVEETIAGRAYRLKGFTIATRVFGRGDDFDPAHDPVVRIQAGRLRRALERYYLVAGGRDPLFIDIPKGHYIPRFAAQTIETDANRPGPSASVGLQVPSPTGPSVAVLPFEDLTSDLDRTFFSIGLADELVTELSRFQDIVVISCRRSTQCTELPADPVEMGRAVGARFVLRGSVRKDSETLKVSTNLSDTKTGRQLWAKAYKLPPEASHLIATQEEIAQSVVAAIASEYGIIARRLSAQSRKKPPAQLSTYEAMLRYYTHQINPNPESSAACFDALQQALEREPEYAPAWSGLATLHCQMYTFDVPGFHEPLDTALRYARRGVSLEPGSQLGRLILAYTCHLADDSDSFHQEIETALALNPNSPYTVGSAGYLLALRGDFETGLPLVDRAISANPCHPDWFHNAYFFHHLKCGKFENALWELENHNLTLGFWRPVLFAATLAKLGRIDEAKVHVLEVKEQKPDFASRARELCRRPLKVDALIDELIDGLRRAGLVVEG